MKGGTRAILIVENDPMVMTFYHYILADAYRLFMAENMGRAQKIIETNQIDCIILDLSLQGYEDNELLIRFFHLLNKNLNTPILGVTTKQYHPDDSEIMDAVCDEYILKPFNVDELFERIAKLTNPS